jgi:hypothetical protein
MAVFPVLYLLGGGTERYKQRVQNRKLPNDYLEAVWLEYLPCGDEKLTLVSNDLVFTQRLTTSHWLQCFC